MAEFAAGYGMSDWSVTVNEPRVTVSDGEAYAVVPVDVRWLQGGTPDERTGFMTVALREGAEGWCIAACAWTWN